MPNLTSREYKVMLHPEMLSNRKSGLKELRKDLAVTAIRLGHLQSGTWKLKEKQTIRFLDTPEHSLFNNGLVFRHRQKLNAKAVQYTLKCRSADRYFASGANLISGDEFEASLKLEEDISAPFHCRTSLSSSVSIKAERDEIPSRISDASRMFPRLESLSRDGGICTPETSLVCVNGVIAYERVYSGIDVHFEETAASVAVILWSKCWQGRGFAAELSFRTESQCEDVFENIALLTQRYFLGIQQLDWCSPHLPTKTQLVYRQRTLLQ